MNKILITTLAVSAATLSSQADLVFDRGLPTANLNNAANPHSNVAWADSETTGSPIEYYLPGDNFTLGGSGTYQLSTIRLWTTATSTGLSLLGGLSGGNMSTISSSYTATSVTYADSTTYQQAAGPFIDLYQIDFDVNISLDAGQTYDFFLNGPWGFVGDSDYRNNNLHASNAALSGSPQEGADDTFLWLHVNDGDQDVETWLTGDGTGTSGFGAGWDKNSDGNVQVFAVQAPEPSTLGIISCALLLLPFSKTLRQKWQKRSNA